MIKLKNNRGVTLVILIVTIIVLLIITGITITLSIESIDQTTDVQDKSEMLIIQHAIQERYVEYTQTNKSDLLIGKKIDYNIDDDADLEECYEIETKKHFEDLGVDVDGVSKSKFIVNYEIGYVEKVGSSTSALKGYNENATNTVTSNMINIY